MILLLTNDVVIAVMLRKTSVKEQLDDIHAEQK